MHTGRLKAIIQNVHVVCGEVSERMDASNSVHVCTKIVLTVSSQNVPSKVVVHFYHTSDKVQVQGGSLIQGTSSAVWLVESLIKPLATDHMQRNKEAIANINAEILADPNTCHGCQKKLNPNAAQPKDQPLSCQRCGKPFHKRCTNRRLTRGNWQRDAWFCQSCILGSDQTQQHSSVDSFNHSNDTALCSAPSVSAPSVSAPAASTPSVSALTVSGHTATAHPVTAPTAPKPTAAAPTAPPNRSV